MLDVWCVVIDVSTEPARLASVAVDLATVVRSLVTVKRHVASLIR